MASKRQTGTHHFVFPPEFDEGQIVALTARAIAKSYELLDRTKDFPRLHGEIAHRLPPAPLRPPALRMKN
jgi:hypothetical protein